MNITEYKRVGQDLATKYRNNWFRIMRGKLWLSMTLDSWTDDLRYRWLGTTLQLNNITDSLPLLQECDKWIVIDVTSSVKGHKADD